MRRCVTFLTVLAWAILVPVVASAQGAAITGVVKDASGAILPGVTVEAASPALIEKTRSVVTDGTGQYRIVDLRAGTYSVTLTLSGFSTVKREGIELSGSFVATVNADLKVGAVEETITVTGETPVVDVQSAKQQVNISNADLAALPTSRLIGGLLNLIPGLTGPDRDVGGAKGVTQQATWGGSIHGGKATEGRMLVDGFQATNGNSGGGLYMANTGTAQEVTVSTSGGLGEAETGGVLTNAIPREGSNKFSAMFFYSGANSHMQGSNYTQELKDAGLLTPPNELIKVYDVNPAGGGRIVRDRLWFYSSFRTLDTWNTVPNMWFNKNDGKVDQYTYDPDLDGPKPFYDNKWGDASTRLTLQATPRNKFGVYYDEQWNCEHCVGGGGFVNPAGNTGGRVSPDGSGPRNNHPGRLYQGTWSSPISNKLLAEAGFGVWELRYMTFSPRRDGKFNPLIVNAIEQSGIIPGLSYRQPGSFNYSTVGNHNWRASLSYVTGAHNMKFGYFATYTNPTIDTYYPQDISSYQLNNGAFNRFTLQGANSNVQQTILNPFAFYAQDQWTRNRLTLQGGVRYDHQRSGYGPFTTSAYKRWPNGIQNLPARLINPAIEYPAMDGVSMDDITPRMGAAYDLFGNGKTAIKGNLGKFPLAFTTGSLNLSASSRLPLSTNRSWNDANNNKIIDCDILNPAKNNECGAMSDQSFGKNVFNNSFDPAITNGWGVRPYQWEGGISIQQEVAPRVSVNAGYFVRWYRNFTVTDNLALAATDFDQYTVTATTDPRLEDNSGQTIGPLYDVKPDKFGLTNNYVTAASNYGKQIENWKGVDVSINARMTNGLTVRGGMSTGRTLTDSCEIRAALPETATTNPYCRTSTPFLYQWRGFATYDFPWEIQLSGTWQLNPGLQLQANRTVPNAQVKQSLSRDLAGSATNVTVNFVNPGSMYSDKINQIDLRLAKIMRWKSHRAQVGLDLYNLTNTSVATNMNFAYAPPPGLWQQPTDILPARFIKFSMQLDF
jgi:hypothetical protein